MIKNLHPTLIPAYQEMVINGFSNISLKEINLYNIIGEIEFRKVVDAAFEYAYLEAKFLKINKKTKGFTELCLFRRNGDVTKVLEEIIKDIEHNSGIPFYEPSTSEEMLDEIRKKYSN